MIPILYKENTKDFSNLGLGPLKETIECNVKEVENDTFVLNLKYPINGYLFNELLDNCFVVADANPVLKNQIFKIKKHTKPINGICSYYAEHISYDTIGFQILPKNISIESKTAQECLNIWKENQVTKCPFNVYSDIETVSSTTWEFSKHENARQILGGVEGSILQTYNGQYLFDNFNINLLKERGKDRGVLLAYGRNIKEIEESVDLESLYSAVLPYSIYQEEAQEGEEEGEEILLTLPEITVSTNSEFYFSEQKIKKVDFSADEIKTVDQLRTRCERYIKENKPGEVNFNLKLTHVDLSKVSEYKNHTLSEIILLCDTVHINFKPLNIIASGKVISVDWNVLLDKYNSLEIGNTKKDLSSSFAKNTASNSVSYSDLYKATSNITFKNPGSTGGNILIYPEKGSTQDLFILDTSTAQSSKNILRFNENGLQQTSSGFNGVYNTLISNSGIVDLIGKLSGSIVSGDKIYTVEIDSGELAIKNNTGNIIFKVSGGNVYILGEQVKWYTDTATNKKFLIAKE